MYLTLVENEYTWESTSRATFLAPARGPNVCEPTEAAYDDMTPGEKATLMLRELHMYSCFHNRQITRNTNFIYLFL